MTLQEVVNKFKKHPKYLTNGAGKLSKRFKCSKETIYRAKKIVRNSRGRLPKILIFDIETSPSITYTWKRFKENIGVDQVIQDPIMLTWAAKWLYGSEILSDCITTEELKNFNDYRIVKSLWDLINEADIVVAHYGDKFDIPTLNSRAIVNGIPPFSFTQSIDTKKVASKLFRFPSNKLEALGTYFGVGHKIKTDFTLWKRCMELEQAALDEMLTYNKQDVVLLEEVYLKLRPYIKGHPNIGLYLESDKPVCANCGSDHLHEEGEYYTTVGRFKVYRCECGALSRVRHNNYSKEYKGVLLTSVSK